MDEVTIIFLSLFFCIYDNAQYYHYHHGIQSESSVRTLTPRIYRNSVLLLASGFPSVFFARMMYLFPLALLRFLRVFRAFPRVLLVSIMNRGEPHLLSLTS